jgi:hypothetical protein
MMSKEDESAGSGGLTTEPAWYEGVSGWQPISRTFIERELGKPNPDYRSLADRLAGYSVAERHAGWIGVAQSAPLRMARTRAYVEALHNDPDPTSVAWGWLDGDFDLMERVEHVLRPDDPHTPETVEALRDRLGSILDAGGAQMPAAAEAEPAEEAEPEPGSAPLQAAPAGTTAADQAWQQLAASDPDPRVVQPAAVEPAGSSPAPEPAPTPTAPSSAQSPAPGWLPTHYVPREGMPAWDYPDPSRPPRVMLNAGLGLVIDGVAGDWALVRAVNGWKGWVDGRRLWPRS